LNITDVMLTAAVRKAIEVGLLPKVHFCDVVGENWQRVREVIQAAVQSADDNADFNRQQFDQAIEEAKHDILAYTGSTRDMQIGKALGMIGAASTFEKLSREETEILFDDIGAVIDMQDKQVKIILPAGYRPDPRKLAEIKPRTEP
jgi:hypothetical protein